MIRIIQIVLIVSLMDVSVFSQESTHQTVNPSCRTNVFTLADEATAIFVGQCREIRASGKTTHFTFKVKEIIKGKDVFLRVGQTNYVDATCWTTNSFCPLTPNDPPERVQALHKKDHIVFMGTPQQSNYWFVLQADPWIAFQSSTPETIAAIQEQLKKLKEK